MQEQPTLTMSWSQNLPPKQPQSGGPLFLKSHLMRTETRDTTQPLHSVASHKGDNDPATYLSFFQISSNILTNAKPEITCENTNYIMNTELSSHPLTDTVV